LRALLAERNRLKLGLFAHNGNAGALTRVPESYTVSWPSSVELSRIADEAGYDAIVPFMRWKGYVDGDPDHRSHECLETYTWAAATGQATSAAAVFATSHVFSIHPLLAAKQSATVDQITGGRFALNLVAGWLPGEFRMFGIEGSMSDEDRYAQAAEWLTLLRRFWTEDEEFDFDGRFYRVQGGISRPRPLVAPPPPVMSAGSSAAGREFAARHADLAFVTLRDEVEGVRAQIDEYRQLARTHGREIQIWAFTYVIHRDTHAEAEAYERRVAQHADVPAVEGWLAGTAAPGRVPAQFLETFRHRSIVGMGGYPLVGTAEEIAERLLQLSDAGLDGLLLSWLDFADGMDRFNRQVMPELVSAGVRER
jgi:FMNH2-dependent dimethyl sulfone monooxygenase